jgi:hypothetical protein
MKENLNEVKKTKGIKRVWLKGKKRGGRGKKPWLDQSLSQSTDVICV